MPRTEHLRRPNRCSARTDNVGQPPHAAELGYEFLAVPIRVCAAPLLPDLQVPAGDRLCSVCAGKLQCGHRPRLVVAHA
jgi:hypothetical protein